MKALLITATALLAIQTWSSALEPKNLYGEWIATHSSVDEDGIKTVLKELKIFRKNGNYYGEALVAVSRKEDDVRLFTFGGPTKGSWEIKGQELHVKSSIDTIDFFSSVVDEFNRALLKKLSIEELEETTILSLISQTKDKLVFKEKSEGTLLTYSRRPVPIGKAPAWKKSLASYTFEELGTAPKHDIEAKSDPTGERYRRLSKVLLDLDGFKFSLSLPTFNSREIGGKLRAKEEIATRILCNYLCWAFVYTSEKQVSSEKLKAYISHHKLDNKLTKREKEILSSKREKAEAKYGNSIGWKLENTWALAWVLGFEQDIDIDQIPFGEATAPALLKFMQSLAKDPKAFLKTCQIRPLTEVAQMEDVFYCTHNAVRSAQTGQAKAVPANFHPVKHGGVIHEKRHALTWVLSPGVSWDDTDLST